MKFLKDLFIALVIVSPLIIVGYRMLNVEEKALISSDELASSGVNILARGVIAYEKKFLQAPDTSSCAQDSWINSCLIDTEIIISPPTAIKPDLVGCLSENGYCYIKTDNGYLILAKVDSLKYQSYCMNEDEAYFAYVSSEDRSGVVCLSSFSPPEKMEIHVI